MPEATVIALFDEFENAREAADDLARTGIPAERIALLTNNANRQHPTPTTNPSFAAPEPVGGADATADLGMGVGAGMGLGGVFGVLLKISSLAIPGIGPVIAAGPWVTMFATIGGLAGGVVATFMDQGMSTEDAQLYAEGLRRGSTLLSVGAETDRIPEIRHILFIHGAVDIEKRDLAWRAEGWVGFDQDCPPLSAAEIAAIRAREAKLDHKVQHRHGLRHYFKDRQPEHFAGVSNVTTHFAEDMLKS